MQRVVAIYGMSTKSFCTIVQASLLGEPSVVESNADQGVTVEEKVRRSVDRAMEAWLVSVLTQHVVLLFRCQ